MDGYDELDLGAAVEAAIRAPSMHNSQPWQLSLTDGTIVVSADPGHRLATADRTGWASRLACGAAVFNARLALANTGRPAEVTLHPAPGIIARLTPGPSRPPTYAEAGLYEAVPRRYSNRGPFYPDPVPADIRVRLIEAARAEGAWLDLLVGMTALTGFSQIAHSADRVLRRDDRYQAELAAWAHADGSPDGVPTRAGGPLPEPYDLVPQRPFGDHSRAPGRDYEPEPLIGILGVPGDLPRDQTTAGQALQRVLLTAVDAGLDSSMVSQPIEVRTARDQLRRSLGRQGFPQMAVRFGYGTPGHPTPRRSLELLRAAAESNSMESASYVPNRESS